MNLEYWFKILETVKVVDGDTVDLRLDQGFNNHTIQRIRLSVVDTPEAGQPGYAAAKQFVVDFLSQPFHDYLVLVTKVKADNWGRYIGRIIDDTTGKVLNDELLDLGLAKVWTPK